MSRFLSTIYNIRVRVVSDIQTLAFGSSLYIRYNTAAHVVNSTYYMAFQNSLFWLVDKRSVKTHIRTVVRIFRIWTGVPDVVYLEGNFCFANRKNFCFLIFQKTTKNVSLLSWSDISQYRPHARSISGYYQIYCGVVLPSPIQSWYKNIVATLCRQPCGILVISLLYQTC
jgi:hypothetical protein